jgi:DNA repair exonuclease SbcCD ATPase subunit
MFIAAFLGPSALAATSQAQIMDEIQQQILSLRKEFKLRIEKRENAQHTIAEKLQEKITNLLSTQESVYSSQPEIAKKIQQFQTLLDTYAVQMESFEQITDAIEMTMHSSLDQIEQRFSQLKKQGGYIALAL